MPTLTTKQTPDAWVRSLWPSSPRWETAEYISPQRLKQKPPHNWRCRNGNHRHRLVEPGRATPRDGDMDSRLSVTTLPTGSYVCLTHSLTSSRLSANKRERMLWN